MTTVAERNSQDGCSQVGVRGKTVEDQLNESVSKILVIPRSPVVSEVFNVPTLERETPSSLKQEETVSTRAISPPSSHSISVLSAPRSNGVVYSNGSPFSTEYSPLKEKGITEQFMSLDLGKKSPGRYPTNLAGCMASSSIPTSPQTKSLNLLSSSNQSPASPGISHLRSSVEVNDAITLRLLMSSKDTGSVIGKGGSFVKSVRDRSNAKINISSDSFSNERLVTVSGSMDSVNCAFMMMAAKLESDCRAVGMGMSSPVLQFRIVLPTTQCGCLIGRAGSKIKEIRDVSNASIQVSGEQLPNSSEREVQISGTLTQLSLCVQQMSLVLAQSPPKGPIQMYSPPPQTSPLLRTQLSSPGVGSPSNGGTPSVTNGNNGTMTTSQQMKIPNDLIGCVIGRKGSKINEIRMMSGAQIKISNNEGELVDRMVSITGTPDSVTLAQYLISSRIQTEVNGLASSSLL